MSGQHPFPSPQKAALSICFVIVGGGIAGLACAYALGRVGHRVIVLEKGTGVNQDGVSGGLRLAPNMSKILNHWGLGGKLNRIAAHSDAISFISTETGELLGRHTWNKELIRESGGHFNVTPHTALVRFLQNLARSVGVQIRFNAPVRSIDPTTRVATLASGELVHGDVIVGADGPWGSARSHFTQEPDEGTVRFMMYSTTISKDLMKQDPELAYFYDQTYIRQYCWYGSGVHVMGYQTGATAGTDDFEVCIYSPPDGQDYEGTWEDFGSHERMIAAASNCEPRLQKLIRMGSRPRCIAVKEIPPLESWVHEAGRMVLIGDAAHHIRPGGVQTCAMAFEDGAVLGQLFSHLRTEDQISTFLWAYEDLRQPRCASVAAEEIYQLIFSSLPSGPEREMRDDDLRAKERAGRNVLEPPEDEDAETVAENWEKAKYLFGYDAEDTADNWWVQWGLLRERAKGVELHLPAVEVMAEVKII